MRYISLSRTPFVIIYRGCILMTYPGLILLKMLIEIKMCVSNDDTNPTFMWPHCNHMTRADPFSVACLQMVKSETINELPGATRPCNQPWDIDNWCDYEIPNRWFGALQGIMRYSYHNTNPSQTWIPTGSWSFVTHWDPDSKFHVANMGPIWGRQDPGGPHVGPMNFAIWGPKRNGRLVADDSSECIPLKKYLNFDFT